MQTREEWLAGLKTGDEVYEARRWGGFYLKTIKVTPKQIMAERTRYDRKGWSAYGILIPATEEAKSEYLASTQRKERIGKLKQSIDASLTDSQLDRIATIIGEPTRARGRSSNGENHTACERGLSQD